MDMIQCDFHRYEYGDASKAYYQTVWVDASFLLKEGDVVTFKDDQEKWTVLKVYSTRMQTKDLEKKWGLDLPRSQRTEK